MHINRDYVNSSADIPYGVTSDDIVDAIRKFYSFTETMQDEVGGWKNIVRANNALSDAIGNFLTTALADSVNSICHNEKQYGFPDLLPCDQYDDYSVERGTLGIETKCSKQVGSWQAHNASDIHIMIFRYDFDTLEIVQVMCAQLTSDDWNVSPGKNNGRTRTAAINSNGMNKLRGNAIYENPAYRVNR